MDIGIKKILFAKYLVEYVGDYNYRHLDSKTIKVLQSQDIFQLASSSPSDKEFLIASKRIDSSSFICDSNYLTIAPYYELLCMYAELGFFKKFIALLHYLDSEVRVLSEAVESHDMYYLPLYTYLVFNGDRYDVFDNDDDTLIGHCEYPGGPITRIESLQKEDVVKTETQMVSSPFQKVLDRFLTENERRYFPERFEQTEESVAVISNCDQASDLRLDDEKDLDSSNLDIVDESMSESKSENSSINEDHREDIDVEFESVGAPKDVSIITNSGLRFEDGSLGLRIFSPDRLRLILTFVPLKIISKLFILKQVFCSKNANYLSQFCATLFDKRLIDAYLISRGLNVSVLRKSCIT